MRIFDKLEESASLFDNGMEAFLVVARTFDHDQKSEKCSDSIFEAIESLHFLISIQLSFKYEYQGSYYQFHQDDRLQRFHEIRIEIFQG